MAEAKTYLDYLQELIQISEQVYTTTGAQDWDGLLAALAQRQTIMDQIDALPAEARLLDSNQAAEARRLLERVAAGDAESISAIDAALNSTRSSLQESSSTRASISAYRRTVYAGMQMAPARFVDKHR